MVRAIWDGTEASRWPCQLSDCVLTAECTSSNVTSGCMQLKKEKKKVLEMLPWYVRVRETDKTSIKFTSEIVLFNVNHTVVFGICHTTAENDSWTHCICISVNQRERAELSCETRVTAAVSPVKFSRRKTLQYNQCQIHAYSKSTH